MALTLFTSVTSYGSTHPFVFNRDNFVEVLHSASHGGHNLLRYAFLLNLLLILIFVICGRNEWRLICGE